MTQLSQQIFQQHQVRKARGQKDAFIALLRSRFPQLRVERGGSLGSRNLVVGDVASARVVFTAHYDTCAVLPFPNVLTPKNIPLYILYNIALVVPMFLIGAALWALLGWAGHFLLGYLAFLLVLLGAVALMIAGPANRHTANDNTSGVITLCELLQAMPEALRAQVCAVFFDHEEIGLVGSARFAKCHRAQMKDKLLINFDCVGDGDTLLVVAKKAAQRRYGALLQQAFSGEPGKTVRLEKASRTLYPSDQANFPCGVAVAAFRTSRIFGLYLDKIHTRRDTVLDESNVQLLVRDCLCLTRLMCTQEEATE